jgi:hypothetical protein
MSARALTRRKEDWGQLSPALRALPNNKWRNFVEFYVLEKPGYGSQVNAARRAGFGKSKTSALNMARIASRLMRDDRILLAISEEARKVVRGAAPQAAKALLNLVCDPEHKDHARGIAMVLARTDPEITRTDLQVTHRVLDPDQEALEELRALRHLGTAREKLLELFGGNGLARLEKLEAADVAHRAASAKIIDGEAIELPATNVAALPHCEREEDAPDG